MADEPVTTPQDDTGAGGETSIMAEAATLPEGGETPPTETPTSDTPPVEGETKEEPKPEGPPEKYELTVPEGSTVDAPLMEKFEATVKEMGLTNEQAQKLVDLYSNKQVELGKAFASTVEQWRAELKADPNYQETFGFARKGMQFGDPEFQQLVSMPGWGDNPIMVRFLAKIGKAVGEDRFIEGGGARADADPLQSLFPTMYPKN